MRRMNNLFIKKFLKQIIVLVLSVLGILFIILLILGYRPVILEGTSPDWAAIGALGTWMAAIFAAIASVFLYNQANIHKKIDMISKKESIYLSLKNVFSFCDELKEVFDNFTVQDFEEKEKVREMFDSLSNLMLENLKNDIKILRTTDYIFAEEINKDISILLDAIQIIFSNYRQISLIAKYFAPDTFKGYNALKEPICRIKEAISTILSKEEILIDLIKKQINLSSLEK